MPNFERDPCKIWLRERDRTTAQSEITSTTIAIAMKSFIAENRTRPKNTSPPYSAIAASHASSDPRKYPASAELPCHSKSLKISHSDPGKYPSPPIPAQSSSADSGSGTSHHFD